MGAGMENSQLSLPELSHDVLGIIASAVTQHSPKEWCKAAMTCRRLWNAELAYLTCREPLGREGLQKTTDMACDVI